MSYSVQHAPWELRRSVDVTHVSRGAKGDGTANDRDAFATALDHLRLQGGGVLTLPPGRRFRVAGDLTWNVADGPLSIEAHGAEVVYDGDEVMLTIAAPGSAIQPRATVHGGKWWSDGSGVGFRIQDCGRTLIDGAWVDFRAGTAIQLRNWSAWTEQTSIVNSVLAGRAALDFVPASVSGGRGTSSFARTRMLNCTVTGSGVHGDTTPFVRCRGGVYDSLFWGVGGNCKDDNVVFHCEGAMGGTLIGAVGYERNTTDGGGPAAMFHYGEFTGTSPTLVDPIVYRNMDLFTATSSHTKGVGQTLYGVTTTVEGDLEVAGRRLVFHPDGTVGWTAT